MELDCASCISVKLGTIIIIILLLCRVRWTRVSADCPPHVRKREFSKISCPYPRPCPPFQIITCPCPRPGQIIISASASASVSVSASVFIVSFLWRSCPLRVRGQGRTKVSADCYSLTRLNLWL